VIGPVVFILEERVDTALDAGLADIVDIAVADRMRRQVTQRIDAPLGGAEFDAGNAEIVDRIFLAGRQRALEVGEAAPGDQLGADFGGRQIRQSLVDQ